jgi:hypothetical protein
MDVVEEWRDCVCFEQYAVSNLGNVKNKKTGRILKPSMADGYKHYKLSKDKVSYNTVGHRLVALAFLENPDNKPQIDHIDNNPGNNIVTNLRWCTICENAQNKDRSKIKGAVPFRGVAKHLNGKFQAHVGFNGTSIHLGLFDSAEEASEMYEAVAKGFYGEFYKSQN